jgi:uncharacterized membrane protein
MEANVTIPSGQTAPERARRSTCVNVGGRERWLSAIGGGALAAYGLRRRGVSGVALASIGGALMARGAMGRCAVYRALGVGTAADALPSRRTRIERSVTIARPREEVHRFLRDPDHAEELLSPFGRMRVVEDVEGEKIVWRSVDVGEGERLVTARLGTAPGGRGTEVSVTFEHTRIPSKLGRALIKLLGDDIEQRVARGLRRIKQRMEVGEVATVEGQTSGRRAG